MMAVQVKRISIYVEQMKRALDFYRMVGLDIPDSADGEHHVEVELAGLRFAFDLQEAAGAFLGGWREPVGYRMELAFQVDGRDRLDELYRQLTQQGYAGFGEPRDTPWGERYAMVKDPDGNLVSLVA